MVALLKFVSSSFLALLMELLASLGFVFLFSVSCVVYSENLSPLLLRGCQGNGDEP
jgi:hypothetical protein